MLVLCKSCNNHYEDTTDSPECPPAGDMSGGYQRHEQIAPLSPISEHLMNVGRGGPNPRMTGESWPEGRGPSGARRGSAVP